MEGDTVTLTESQTEAYIAFLYVGDNGDMTQ